MGLNAAGPPRFKLAVRYLFWRRCRCVRGQAPL